LQQAPLLQASYRLAKAFGWTPQEVQALTMAQITLYLQLLAEDVGSE